MEELKDAVCEYCGKELKEEDRERDDVVYCPVCGTPVHRSCWNEKGGCPFESRHKDGFVYQTPGEKSGPTAPPVIKNRDGTYTAAQPEHRENNPNFDGGEHFDRGEPFDGGEPFDDEEEDRDSVEALRRLIEGRSGEKDSREKTEADFAEKKFDGVSEREMMCFLNVDGPQKLYRLAVIKYMIVNNKKAGFNLFAGLLNPYNQFYKGMGFLGVLLTVFNYIMGLPRLIAYYMTFFKEQGEEAVSAINQSALLSASGTLWIIQLAVVVLLCIFGDYLYIAFMLKKIKKIRARFQNEQSEEYLVALAQAGRPRISMVLLGFGLQAAFSLITMIAFIKIGF